MQLLQRLIAYVINDAKRAEGLDAPAPGAPPAWLIDAIGDETQIQIALEAATTSVKLANAAVDSLQDKASKHLTFLMVIVPLALAGTGLSHPPAASTGILPYVGFILFVIADLLLLLAIALASLASGLALGGGISIDRLGDLADGMGRDFPNSRTSALRAAEVEALRFAADLAHITGARIAQDLYSARRFTFLSAIFATLSVIALFSVSGADAFL